MTQYAGEQRQALVVLMRVLRSHKSSPVPGVLHLLILHCARMNYAEAVESLVNGLTPADRDSFLLLWGELKKVHFAAEELSAGNISPALNWCAQRASRCRRIEPEIVFELNKQHFLHLVKMGQREAALRFAPRLSSSGGQLASPSAPSPSSSSALHDASNLMGVFVFPDPPRCGVPHIEALFSPDALKRTQRAFRRAAFQVLGLTPASPLVAALAPGIAALKAPPCSATPPPAPQLLHAPIPTSAQFDGSRGGGSATGPFALGAGTAAWCPLCSDRTSVFRRLAVHTPGFRTGSSRLQCSITGAPIDEHNPAFACSCTPPCDVVYEEGKGPLLMIVGANALSMVSQNETRRRIYA